MEIEKPKKPRIPIEIRWRIVGYIEAGKSLHEAASYFNHSYSSIQNIWKKFQELGAVSSKRRPGRPTEITEEKKIEIGSHLSEPYSSLKEVSIAHEISKTATFNIAHEFGLYYKYFAEKEEITETTALKRLNYAGQGAAKDLSDIVFSDESYFHIFRNTLGSWTLEKQIIVEKINPNYALMVYGALSASGKSAIAICDKGFKINSETYVEILKTTLLPFLKNYHPNHYQLIQDNARAHIAKKTRKWMEDEKLSVVEEYPPYSPDFNAIEGIGKGIKDKVEKMQPKNINQLKQAIEKSGGEISLENILPQIERVKHNLQKCLDNNGY